MDILHELKTFLIAELVIDSSLDEQLLTSDKDLVSYGIIDSLGILKLTAFIEEKFKIKMTDEDIVPENFRTLSSISKLIESKQKR